MMEMFSFEVSALELIIRGTIIWWFIFLVLRFIMRRDMGEIGTADILLLVLIADAAQNGMADEYNSIPEGLVLMSTLFFWNWLLDTLALRFKYIEKLIEPPPVRLIRNGRYLYRNIKKYKLDEKDILAEMRKSGIDNVMNVKSAWFESDGTISVIPKP